MRQRPDTDNDNMQDNILNSKMLKQRILVVGLKFNWHCCHSFNLGGDGLVDASTRVSSLSLHQGHVTSWSVKGKNKDTDEAEELIALWGIQNLSNFQKFIKIQGFEISPKFEEEFFIMVWTTSAQNLN